MSDIRVHRCLDPGTAVVVATVGADGTPACGHAIAVASDDDLATVTVYVPLATSQEIIQNLAASKRIAVTATHPFDHCTAQVKGVATDVRLAADGDAAFVRARLDAFADALDLIGVPRRLTRAWAHWPAFAIRVRVEEVFEQTPGPNAGTRVR